jgi:hypothetical protein
MRERAESGRKIRSQQQTTGGEPVEECAMYSQLVEREGER